VWRTDAYIDFRLECLRLQFAAGEAMKSPLSNIPSLTTLSQELIQAVVTNPRNDFADKNGVLYTIERAQAANIKRIAVLNKEAKNQNNIELSIVANKLVCCTVEAPCESGACQICSHVNQKMIINPTRKLHKKVPLGIISVIPRIRVMPSFMSRDIFLESRIKLIESLRNSPASFAIIGGDVSLNVSKTELYPHHFKPHFWIFVPESERKAIAKHLKQDFIKSPSVSQPVRPLEFDGRNNGIAYLLKSEFRMRIATHADDANSATASTARINNPEMAELCLALDRAGFASRLSFYGLDFICDETSTRLKITETKGGDPTK
jgi:hypothetical protein